MTTGSAITDKHRYRSGYSLPQFFYTSETHFQKELDIFLNKHWHLVNPVSSIPNPGDFLRFDIANESIIVVRNQDGAIRAHHNVCRHRTSKGFDIDHLLGSGSHDGNRKHLDFSRPDWH